MEFRPCFHHALLAFREGACDQINRINSVNRDLFLIVGVEVGRMVLSTRFQVHPDDDAVKPA
jgi:hypothetical protein